VAVIHRHQSWSPYPRGPCVYMHVDSQTLRVTRPIDVHVKFAYISCVNIIICMSVSYFAIIYSFTSLYFLSLPYRIMTQKKKHTRCSKISLWFFYEDFQFCMHILIHFMTSEIVTKHAIPRLTFNQLLVSRLSFWVYANPQVYRYLQFSVINLHIGLQTADNSIINFSTSKPILNSFTGINQ